MKHILLPVDFSCDVHPAVDFVKSFVPPPYKVVFANAYVCDLDNVLKEFDYHVTDDQLHLILSTVSRDFQDKLNKMENLKYEFSDLGVVDSKMILAKGISVEDAIKDYLGENNFDLMVVDSKNTTSFFGYLFKSFTAEMLSKSKVPTTIIHHKK